MLEQNNHISLVSAVSFLFATSIFLPSESQNSQAPTAWLMQFSVSPAKTNFLLFPFLDLGTSEKAVTLGGKKKSFTKTRFSLSQIKDYNSALMKPNKVKNW